MLVLQSTVICWQRRINQEAYQASQQFHEKVHGHHGGPTRRQGSTQETAGELSTNAGLVSRRPSSDFIRGFYLLLPSFLGISLTHPVGELCFRKKNLNIFICHLRHVFVREPSSLQQEPPFQLAKPEVISPTPFSL